MGTRSKKAKSAKASSSSGAPEVRPIKAFYHPAGDGEDFVFARLYWPSGVGERESILSRFIRKRRPVATETGIDTAAKVEVLLPYDAPEEYVDGDFLVRRYEETLPPNETTAYLQVTLKFDDVPNLHHPYEVARAWVKTNYVERYGTPLVLILHAPHRIGSDADGHVHALIFPRRLCSMGWTGMRRFLANDETVKEHREFWSTFKLQELSRC